MRSDVVVVVVVAFAAGGCGSFLSADDALADEFARFKANGGVCLSQVPVDADTTLETATRYRHRGFDAVAADVVSGDEGFVDYDQLTADPEQLALLDATLAQMQAVDPARFATGGERLVFWINAYNAIVLRHAARGYATDAAFRVDDDDFAFFKRREHTVNGVVYSLNEIENGVIRGDRTHDDLSGLSNEEFAPFQQLHDDIWAGEDLDPRVHFLLNCASRSCPGLAPRAWSADTLEEDLDERSRLYVLDNARGAGPNGISELFGFYFADFDVVGGIDGFIGQYRPLEGVSFGLTLTYDWSLNRVIE
ncbi:MAG: DUF547 domain-containing protein [Deltaproteobacteria bacterium]|nr:DUF547 domain-containing protein [Deltaproteobacteria bacterium]